jgi:hypothetical protein
MQAYTLTLLQEKSGGFAMLQQRSLNKIAGLVKNIKVLVKSVVNLLSFYLLINVINSAKELV